MFPTATRNSALGLCSTMARVVGLAAPAVAGLDSVWPPLPFLVMGGSAVVVGSLSYLLPETQGAPLPQTVEEAERLQAGGACGCMAAGPEGLVERVCGPKD